MTHSEVVMAAYKWLVTETKCGVAFREYKSARFSTEIPDVIGFDSDGVSYVIECKVSREDFLADAKKLFRINPETGMGAQRYYCCPVDMIRTHEMPRLWGLIYVDDLTGKAWCVLDPYETADGVINRFERNLRGEYKVMYSALRRMDIRGALEQIYEKVTSATSKIPRGTSRVNVGEIWFRKMKPNQQFEVIEVGEHLIKIRSLKSGVVDSGSHANFYIRYEKQGEGT